MKTKPIYRQDAESAARKALIAANADYFSWTEAQQERFRATREWSNSTLVLEEIHTPLP